MTEQQIVAAVQRYNRQLTLSSITPLLSGLSNDNYLVCCQDAGFLIKHYRDHWPDIGLDAQQHFANRGFCPAPVWLEKVNRIAIFNYIEGDIAKRYHPDLIKQLVSLHKHVVHTKSMDVAWELEYYKSNRLYQRYSKVITKALGVIKKLPSNLGFCHNDLVRENIIINQNQAYLIDFEYAKTNDIYFDLASLVVSFDMNVTEKQQLLDDYQQQLNQQQLKPQQTQKEPLFYNSLDKLHCYQVVFLVLCICWYDQHEISQHEINQRATKLHEINEKVLLLCAQLDELIKEVAF